jgi:hypothetical protein
MIKGDIYIVYNSKRKIMYVRTLVTLYFVFTSVVLGMSHDSPQCSELRQTVSDKCCGDSDAFVTDYVKTECTTGPLSIHCSDDNAIVLRRNGVWSCVPFVVDEDTQSIRLT